MAGIDWNSTVATVAGVGVIAGGVGRYMVRSITRRLADLVDAQLDAKLKPFHQDVEQLKAGQAKLEARAANLEGFRDGLAVAGQISSTPAKSHSHPEVK